MPSGLVLLGEVPNGFVELGEVPRKWFPPLASLVGFRSRVLMFFFVFGITDFLSI